MPRRFFWVKAFLTLLFVSSVIEDSPDSKRIMVRGDRPAILANSTFRRPNRTRVVFHQFLEAIAYLNAIYSNKSTQKWIISKINGQSGTRPKANKRDAAGRFPPNQGLGDSAQRNEDAISGGRPYTM